MTRTIAAKPVVAPAVQAAFERLMKAYPPRGDNPRAAALKAFATLVAEGEDAEAMADAAGRFALAMRAEARAATMIPHTRTWLSQRRFEDYLTDAPASAPAGPNPEHPLFWMAAEIGDAAWLSYIGPLQVSEEGGLPLVTARTAFQLDRIRKSGWIQQIEARLGVACWRVTP